MTGAEERSRSDCGGIRMWHVVGAVKEMTGGEQAVEGTGERAAAEGTARAAVAQLTALPGPCSAATHAR